MVGLDAVEGPGDVSVDPEQLQLAISDKTGPEAVRIGKTVPAIAAPPGLHQVGVLAPRELWPKLLGALVEAQDEEVNGNIMIRVQLWNGRACHPEITRNFRVPGERRQKSRPA